MPASTRLPLNGTLVLGQDQDIKGGDFGKYQSYVGRLTQLNIYNVALSLKQASFYLQK